MTNFERMIYIQPLSNEIKKALYLSYIASLSVEKLDDFIRLADERRELNKRLGENKQEVDNLIGIV